MTKPYAEKKAPQSRFITACTIAGYLFSGSALFAAAEVVECPSPKDIQCNGLISCHAPGWGQPEGESTPTGRPTRLMSVWTDFISVTGIGSVSHLKCVYDNNVTIFTTLRGKKCSANKASQNFTCETVK
jgi:hypothetical protein